MVVMREGWSGKEIAGDFFPLSLGYADICHRSVQLHPSWTAQMEGRINGRFYPYPFFSRELSEENS